MASFGEQPRSSSGLGHQPLTLVTGVRNPYGAPILGAHADPDGGIATDHGSRAACGNPLHSFCGLRLASQQTEAVASAPQCERQRLLEFQARDEPSRRSAQRKFVHLPDCDSRTESAWRAALSPVSVTRDAAPDRRPSARWHGAECSGACPCSNTGGRDATTSRHSYSGACAQSSRSGLAGGRAF